jgi:hypothetical protein
MRYEEFNNYDTFFNGGFDSLLIFACLACFFAFVFVFEERSFVLDLYNTTNFTKFPELV